MSLEGVLFLTAGFGTRDEPLSLLRPKCLLPWGDISVLKRLALQTRSLEPRRIIANASRCPGDIKDVLESVWPDKTCEVYFEERPLGACASLGRLSRELFTGTWLLLNTDMVLEEFPGPAMLKEHAAAGAAWSALIGPMPETGSYSGLKVDGDGCFGEDGDVEAHYYGASLMEPCIPSLASRMQLSSGLFSRLAPLARAEGHTLRVFEGSGDWLDMGSIEVLRRNILSAGNFVHPAACISSDAVLKGTWNIGAGCMAGGGTVIRNSVMLEGSTLEDGELTDSILPWSGSSMDGAIT